jgi:catechol 2,3-dioxygenase-like lactoylglutathione lyase family enzyme
MLSAACLPTGDAALTDMATPNLPSRDFDVTSRFFGRLGFVETWRDEGWMIVRRGDLILEFFPHPGLDPADSWFSCCLRLGDVGAFFEAVLSADVPETATGWPRAHRPKREAWGGMVGALVDPDGTLIRLVQSPD